MSASAKTNIDPRQVALAAAGDQVAWRAIYDDSCPALFNFLCYQTGDREVAKDLLQETYVTALGRLGTYRGEGSVTAWLRTIALRKCLDWRRRAQLRIRKLAALARDATLPTSYGAEETFPGLGKGIQGALDRLSSRQRAALLLRELEDLSFAEVAANLGCNEATARVHHHRACRNLKRWLTEGDDLVFGSNAGGQA